MTDTPADVRAVARLLFDLINESAGGRDAWEDLSAFSVAAYDRDAVAILSAADLARRVAMPPDIAALRDVAGDPLLPPAARLPAARLLTALLSMAANNASLQNRVAGIEADRDAARENLRAMTDMARNAVFAGAKATGEAREKALREAARVAENACLVLPDGGSPMPDEVEVANEASRRILALIPIDPDAPTGCADDALPGTAEHYRAALDHLPKGEGA